MAAQYKTKCPHCGAQFRIGEEHLKQASGNVRCGSCLKVFQAMDHLVKEAPAAKPAKPAAKKPASRPAAAAKPAKPAAQASKAAPPEEWSLPGAETKPAGKDEGTSRWTLNEDSDSSAVDEDYDDKPVTKDEYKGNDTKVSMGSIELSDSFMSLDEDGDDQLSDEDFSDMAGAARGQAHDRGDESWAEKLLEELDDDTPEVPASADDMSLADTDRSAADRKAREDRKERTRQAASADDWADDADDFFNDVGDGLLDEDGLDDDGGLASIELPPPDEVTPRSRARAAMPSMPSMGGGLDVADFAKWSGLSLMALLALATQYMAFNFDHLARTPEWRPLYSTVCNGLGCSLPNPSNISKVRGANLVVRDHPEFGGALIVDIIVFNEADYEQPFPQMELGFTSLQGRAIASRRFAPADYLHGELKGLSTMPVDTPIHISFEIVDPGPEAKNYTLRFLPAPVVKS